MLRQAVPQSTRKPVTRTAITAKLTALVHPDRTDDFTDELELLIRRYAGENFTLKWDEQS